jgi:cytochrome P450
MNDVPDYTRAHSVMRVAVPRGEAGMLAARAERLSEDAVRAAGGRIDVAMALTQSVTTRTFGPYFGTPGPSDKIFADWARLLFRFQFADFNNDPKLLAQVQPVAAELRDYVDGVVADRKASGKHIDDVLGRLLVQQANGQDWLTDEEVRNNLIVCIIGGLPQPPMVIPQMLDVLLKRPKELEAACAAARADDDELLSHYIFEALRYNPLTPGLLRICLQGYKVAAGTWRAKTIPKGATVVALTRSAMFDGRQVPNPTEFRVDRPGYSYMHFGYGMHECFGVYINKVMIPAICKPLLKRRNLRRAPGPDGQLTMDTLFPRRLVVEYD